MPHHATIHASRDASRHANRHITDLGRRQRAQINTENGKHTIAYVNDYDTPFTAVFPPNLCWRNTSCTGSAPMPEVHLVQDEDAVEDARAATPSPHILAAPNTQTHKHTHTHATPQVAPHCTPRMPPSHTPPPPPASTSHVHLADLRPERRWGQRPGRRALRVLQLGRRAPAVLSSPCAPHWTMSTQPPLVGLLGNSHARSICPHRAGAAARRPSGRGRYEAPKTDPTPNTLL